MKILFINEYTCIGGGTDAVVNAEIQGLKDAGMQVKCFSYYNNDFMNSSLFSRIQVYSLTCFGVYLSKRLQSEIDNYKPDIIHFHNIYQIFRSPLWNKIHPGNAKIILHIHNYYPFCLNSLMYRKGYCRLCYDTNSWWPGVLHRCYDNSFFKSLLVSLRKLNPDSWLNNISKVDSIIAVSNYLFTSLVLLGVPAASIQVLYNGVRIRSNIKNNYILYLGNISVEKGILIFCEAASRLPYIRFIAAGEGKELSYIKKKYSRLQNLELLGYVTGIQKEKLLGSCRFLYFPTQCYETFGLVIIEAFSYGKQVLTTGFGATGELVQDGVTGIINPDCDINSQADSILKLWNKSNKAGNYYSECDEFSKKFSIENHIEQLIGIYQKLITPKTIR